ncbi:hypothetical protein KKF81_06850 [Candidatus Micrarchaeota archaeon]|nr:hypothetical protein [Candidatus Micrarchaeota archaeon]MBU1166648.1 hypothetical protein [Candidatus Micrarchaeota archaeon]MBU1886605.1 hypothetical protein [Candidatus Micrarchaeota archaeon]
MELRRMKHEQTNERTQRTRPKSRWVSRFLVGAVAAAFFTFMGPKTENIAKAEDAQAVQIEDSRTPELSEDRTDGRSASSTPEVSASPPVVEPQETEAVEEPRENDNRRPSNNMFDLGMRSFNTESGAASLFLQGTYQYRDNIEILLRAGTMWFPQDASADINFAPFGALLFHPSYTAHDFTIGSYTSVLGTSLNSQLFAAQAFSFSFERKTGEFALRGAVVLDGNLAYPNFDYISARLSLGTSFEWNERLLIYGSMIFYFAADSAAETAYVGNYGARLQSIELGVEARIRSWIIDFSGTYDVINSGALVRLARELNFGGSSFGYVEATVGIGIWADRLAESSMEFVATIGMRLFIPGRRLNSTNIMQYSHERGGGVSQATMSIDDPDINGTNRPVWAYEFESNVLDPSVRTIEDLAYRYDGASTEDLVRYARYLSYIGGLLYTEAANEAMMDLDFFNPEIRRIASMSYDDALYYFRETFRYYQQHGTLRGLPPEIANGIGICPMIHSFAAEFLRLRGVHAIAASVNTPIGPHVITIIMTPDATHLIDYGDLFSTGPRSFDEVLRLYGQHRGATVLRTQLFDGDAPNGSDYRGTFTTSEGRVIEYTLGIDGPAIVDRLLGRSGL